MDKGLSVAKESYLVAVKQASQGLKAEKGPRVVARNIPPALFEIWSIKHESRWKLAYEDDGGVVLLYGDPSRVHENTAGLFTKLILYAVADAAEEAGGIAARNAARKSLAPAASPLCNLVSRRKEPDFSQTPDDCLQHNPTLVGEVAYRNETLPELKTELSRWTERQDLAQICIGINVDDVPAGAADDPYLTIVCKYHRQPHEQLAFGKDTACTSAGLPQYQFRIPLDLIYARSNFRDLFGQQNHISIDLLEVRTLIQKILCGTVKDNQVMCCDRQSKMSSARDYCGLLSRTHREHTDQLDNISKSLDSNRALKLLYALINLSLTLTSHLGLILLGLLQVSLQLLHLLLSSIKRNVTRHQLHFDVLPFLHLGVRRC